MDGCLECQDGKDVFHVSRPADNGKTIDFVLGCPGGGNYELTFYDSDGQGTTLTGNTTLRVLAETIIKRVRDKREKK